jgi:DNA polymerase
VIAWLAGEEWRQDVFRQGGDIYCASASQMFGVPVVKHGVNGHLRQKGKVAELALGYGGSAGALINMGALKMGLKEEELPDIVTLWRQASPRIVDLCHDVGNAVIKAVKYKEPTELAYGLNIWRSGKLLHIELPSGRSLRYFNPQITINRFSTESIKYQNYDAGKWSWAESYGAKIVENIVQGIARDCLRDAMLGVAQVYPDIVMHIHDEMVVEVPEETAEDALKEISAIMGRPVPWAPGLLLRGDGYLCSFYRKD